VVSGNRNQVTLLLCGKMAAMQIQRQRQVMRIFLYLAAAVILKHIPGVERPPVDFQFNFRALNDSFQSDV
jgi:hypothetical protein